MEVGDETLYFCRLATLRNRPEVAMALFRKFVEPVTGVVCPIGVGVTA